MPPKQPATIAVTSECYELLTQLETKIDGLVTVQTNMNKCLEVHIALDDQYKGEMKHLKEKLEGNGKPSVDVRLDRLERSQGTIIKIFGAIWTIFSALIIGALVYGFNALTNLIALYTTGAIKNIP